MLCGLGLLVGAPQGDAEELKTFCNPSNLDYGPFSKGSHGADPVIVPFKNKYYLFDTRDRIGYRIDAYNASGLTSGEPTKEKQLKSASLLSSENGNSPL